MHDEHKANLTTVIRKGLSFLYASSGGLYLIYGRLRSADILLRTAEFIFPPGTVTLHTQRAAYFEVLGQSEDALRSGRRAIEISDRSPLPYINLSAASITLGRYAEALENANLALSKKSLLFKAKPLAIANRLEAYIGLGNLDAAKADLDELSKTLDKKSPVALAAQAELSMAMHDYERALTDLNKALDLCQAFYKPMILRKRAITLKQLGKVDLAGRDEQRATEIVESWKSNNQRIDKELLRAIATTKLGWFYAVVAVCCVYELRLSIWSAITISFCMLSAILRTTVGVLVGVPAMLIFTSLALVVQVPNQGWVQTQARTMRIDSQTRDGKSFYLDDWKGKVVLLYVVKPNTSKERQDFLQISELYEKYPRKIFEVVGIVDSGTRNLGTHGIGTPWTMIDSTTLTKQTLRQLGNLSDQKSYILSPADQHIVQRAAKPEDLTGTLSWMARGEGDLLKHKGSEVYDISWILRVMELGLLALFMVLDRCLQGYAVKKTE